MGFKNKEEFDSYSENNLSADEKKKLTDELNANFKRLITGEWVSDDNPNNTTNPSNRYRDLIYRMTKIEFRYKTTVLKEYSEMDTLFTLTNQNEIRQLANSLEIVKWNRTANKPHPLRCNCNNKSIFGNVLLFYIKDRIFLECWFREENILTFYTGCRPYAQKISGYWNVKTSDAFAIYIRELFNKEGIEFRAE
jgi:hypothetical protein